LSNPLRQRQVRKMSANKTTYTKHNQLHAVFRQIVKSLKRYLNMQVLVYHNITEI